jgi:hypothetical protein
MCDNSPTRILERLLSSVRRCSIFSRSSQVLQTCWLPRKNSFEEGFLFGGCPLFRYMDLQRYDVSCLVEVRSLLSCCLFAFVNFRIRCELFLRIYKFTFSHCFLLIWHHDLCPISDSPAVLLPKGFVAM